MNTKKVTGLQENVVYLQKEEHKNSEAEVLDEESYLRKLFSISPDKGFDLLFRKYYGNLCGHCIRFVHSKTIAEDIVSDIFTTFWQKKLYENIEISYRAYLYKSVRYRSYTYLKTEFLRETEPMDEDQDFTRKEKVQKPDEILLYHELSSRLDRIIKSLPNQSRTAFQLSRLEGKNYSEIAGDLSISVSAVERLISRALGKIRAELKSELFIGILLFIS
jgi:RNA polymerase sigma-70 factor (ECF subfamily)